MSCIQFYVCGVLSLVCALVFETPHLSSLLAAWVPILYAGVLSSGVAYTLQIVGQRNLDPTVASLIMSLESVISALSGWIILHEAMTGREVLGCVLMFGAIVLAQIPMPRKS
jgi:drug/metabolite transporter (DMT)-like permease